MRSTRLRPGHRRPAALAAVALGALCATAQALGIATAPPGTTQLVTRPTGSAPLGPAAAADSIVLPGRVTSADGRYVAFLSRADGLVAGAEDDLGFGVYVKDRQTGAVTLASRAEGPAGAPVEASAGGISLAVASGGVRVAFVTPAAIDPADTNGVQDVYVRDLAAGTTVLASRLTGAAGAPGNGPAILPALSGDGTHVAYATLSSNYPGDADGVFDVYLRDLGAGTTALVSRQSFLSGGAKADGSSLSPAVDEDGSRVAFVTQAANLSATDGNTRPDVYVRDTGGAFATTTLASRADGAGAVGSGESAQAPAISADGRYVAFQTTSTNLNPSQPTGSVYRRDLTANATDVVDRADGAGGEAANARAAGVALSDDGQRVAFVSRATNLAPDDLVGTPDVFVRDLGAGTTTLASRGSGPGGPRASRGAVNVALSGDGSIAIFSSASPELVPGAPLDVVGVFARDLGAQETTLVSRPAGGDPYTTAGIGSVDDHPLTTLFGVRPASISADGRIVAFVSLADGLSDADDDSVANVYARDLLTGRTVLVSRATGPDGAPADADSAEPVVSADGTRVAFTSLATNLAAGTPAGREQVYVRDLAGGTTTLVSRAGGSDGSPGTSYSRAPTISGDGNRIAFETSGAFDPLDGNASNDVYVRDVAAGTTTLVSRAAGAAGAVGDGLSSDASISRDGSRVAFVSRAANLDPADVLDGADLFVRDLAAGTTVLASRHADGGAPANGSVFSPSLDADGSRVAFLSGTPLVGGASGQQVYVRDLAAGTTTLASRADGPAGAIVVGSALHPSLSDDGTVVAFAFTRSGLSPDDADDLGDVFVRDLAAGTTTLASRASSGQKADGGTDDLWLSGNGNCLLLVSGASNLDPSGYLGSVGDFRLGYVRTLAGECPSSPPETTIVAGPGARTNDPTPSVALASDEPGTFECRLDGGGFAPCDAAFTPAPLAPGPHTLDARAVDAARLVDPTPATSAFVVNAAPDSDVRRPGKRLAPGALRALRGTASDDLGVVRVEVAVVRLVGKARTLVAKGKAKPACLGLTAKGRLKRLKLVAGACAPLFVAATGTTTWTRALPATLPPGSYLVLSRAVDADGLAETSFSAQDGNRRTFAIQPAAPKG